MPILFGDEYITAPTTMASLVRPYGTGGGDVPGFLETMLSGVKSSALYETTIGIFTANSPINRAIRNIADSDPTYDWQADAEKYANLYPRTLFEGSESAQESRRRMHEWDDDIRTQRAIAAHPTAYMLGNMGAFAVDMAALSFVPFIGGIGARLGMSAGRLVSGTGTAASVLRGVVGCSIAGAVDVTEVELARALVDDRVTFGEIVDTLPANVLYGMLFSGVMSGAGRLLNSVTPRVDITVGRPVDVPISSRAAKLDTAPEDISGLRYDLPEDVTIKQLEAAASIEPASDVVSPDMVDVYYKKIAPASDDVTKQYIEQFLKIINGGETISVQLSASQWCMQKIALSPLTRALASKVPCLRDKYGPLLHDSAQLRSNITRSLDVTVRTDILRMQGRAQEIMMRGYQAITSDNNNFRVTKDDIDRMVNRALLNDGRIDGAYHPQLKQHIENIAGQVRRLYDEFEQMFDAIYVKQRGKHLVDDARKEVERLELKLKKARDEMSAADDEVVDALINRETKILVDRDVKNGRISRTKDIKKYNKHYWQVKRAVERKYSDRRKAAYEEKVDDLTRQLDDAKAVLNDREGGDFSRDISKIKQTEDMGYIHRVYDYKKILAQPDTFIDDIASKLTGYDGLTAEQARAGAQELLHGLTSRPASRRNTHLINVRGAEHARTVNVPTYILDDWLIHDQVKIIDHMSNTLIPDYHVMNTLGTYDADTFREEIRADIDALVKSGDVKIDAAIDLENKSVRQLQALIDNVRGVTHITNAPYNSRAMYRAASAAKSLTSVMCLGGLVFTGIFDAATMMLNKGLLNFMRDDARVFLNYVFSPKFRRSLRDYHGDMLSCAGFIDHVINKGSTRIFSEQEIPENYRSDVTDWLHKVARAQQKLTGAEALFNALHMTSDYANTLTLRRLCERYASGKKLSVTDNNLLNIARIDGDMARRIARQAGMHGVSSDDVQFLELDSWADAEAADAVRYGVNALTRNSILLPGNEVPEWANTPIGSLFLQYRKFIFASFDRCLLPALSRLSAGEMSVLTRAFTMVAMGGLKEVLSRLASGRDTLSVDEFWAYGIGNSDVLPFAGEIVKEAYLGFHSRGSYGAMQGMQNWLINMFVPASASQMGSMLPAANGVRKLLLGMDDPSPAEIRAIKRNIPLNNMLVLSYILNKAAQGYIDNRATGEFKNRIFY